jgi:hypothetical protein
MEENEVYLGGFYSTMQLRLGTFGVGAGIYATNRRLFIFREDMDPCFNRMVSGSGRKDFVPSKLTGEQNGAIIAELSSRCPPQVALRKHEISSLELKKPPGVFRIGYLKINSTSGEELKVGIGKRPEYEYLRSLLQSFSPQALREV